MASFPLPPSPVAGDLAIKQRVVQGLAYALLGRFRDAEQNLKKAEQLSEEMHSSLSGEVATARGVVSMHRGELGTSEHCFRASLEIARQQQDTFLEMTSLLNLGVVTMRQDHYDESIDWSNAAYNMAQLLHSEHVKEAALGNLGWAFYKMGDFDRSLQLFQGSLNIARDLGAAYHQILWLNNIGLDYYQANQLSLAEDYYRHALDLASKNQNQEQVIDALTELAFVAVQKGQLSEARQYREQAFQLAHAKGDRASELYAVLVEGEIFAREGSVSRAEPIFREVASDAQSDTSLRWEAQDALARLYESEHQFSAADKQYRLALATLEGARSSLQHEEFRLPFLANATHLYDDYIHFLVTEGKTAEALRVADYSRAQTLAEGLGLIRSASSSFAPPAVDAKQTARRMKGAILFYWLGSKHSYLWAINAQRSQLFELPPAAEIDAEVQRYRKALAGPGDVLTSANRDGINLYETLVASAYGLSPPGSRVIVIPDGSLNNLNFETLLVPEPRLHYWIEDVTVRNASSLRLLATAHGPRKNGPAKLLLMGDALAPNQEYGRLPQAAAEMRNIESHFALGERKVYAREQATAPAYLGSFPEQFSYIHFVAHGTASRLTPLDSAVVLSKSSAEEDSFKLYARDIIHRPLRAELVTVSTCYGAGARAFSGEGLVGLSWAFLRAGAHNVIGALWEVSDASTPVLMDELYHGLQQGQSPETALRSAKLTLVRSQGVFRKPFYWGPFQLYVGSRFGTASE